MGMSEELGHVTYEQKGDTTSPVMQAKIDDEIKRLTDESYIRAKNVLTKNKKQLHALAKALLEYETLDGEEVQMIMKGKKLNRKATVPKAAEASI